jgi:hypothetical protein
MLGLVGLVLFGRWGGAVADAVDRRVLLLGSSLLLWGCTGGCWGRPWPGWPACPCCWDWSPSRRPGSPSPPRPRGAIVPRVLPEALVPSANTLSFTASNVGLALGPCWPG